MTKNTKTLLTIGGIAVVGYILYKQFAKSGKSFAGFTASDDFFNASGCKQNDPSCNLCGESCVDGKCYVVRTDNQGKVVGYSLVGCGAKSEKLTAALPQF